MMKKVFKTLSAILLATACLTPGLAWADASPSVELKDGGALKASNMVDVHSVLIEVDLSGAEVAKVKDVALESAPKNAMSSAVYDATAKKVTIAVSSGKNVLELSDGSLGTVTIAAEGATAANPVSVKASMAAFEYIASEDSAAAVQSGAVDTNVQATLESKSSVLPPTPGGNNEGGSGGSGDGSGDGSGSGNFGGPLGSAIDSDDNGNGNGGNKSNATRTADYGANGVVSSTQAGQGANTSLVKTGDVLMICGIGIGVAAIAVVVSMLITRKKASRKE